MLTLEGTIVNSNNLSNFISKKKLREFSAFKKYMLLTTDYKNSMS